MDEVKKNRAICYVAFGDLYIAQALLSIKSLRKIDNVSKVLLVTNKNFNLNNIKFWDKNRDKILIFSESLTKTGTTKQILINM